MEKKYGDILSPIMVGLIELQAWVAVHHPSKLKEVQDIMNQLVEFDDQLDLTSEPSHTIAGIDFSESIAALDDL